MDPGSIFATFDAAGQPTGFYALEVFPNVVIHEIDEQLVMGRNPAIPEAAIEIPLEAWEQFIVNPGQRRWNGTGIEPCEPVMLPLPPATSVSAAQGKTALFNAGLDDEVEAIVAAHPYKPVRIFYENAGYWEIQNPYVRAIAVELGLIVYGPDGAEDEAGLLKLFEAASKI